METAIALGLFLLLSAGTLFLWQHSAEVARRTLARQAALENARAAMDAIIANIQMGHEIRLRTWGNANVELVTIGPCTAHPAELHGYTFTFRPAQQVLDFPNPGNPLAQNIATLEITYKGNRLEIFITTGCPNPIELHGSASTRHKHVQLLTAPMPIPRCPRCG